MTMTALGPGSSLSMAVPQTQNTAPVLEFRCLFTKDLRQKQKRWQDGKLKYHTFNKRVMVYDERSNFVGDTHWREDSDFDDGEELELDRSGTLVQVGEFLGKREQDLSELIDKPRKEKEERLAARTASSPARSALHNRSQVTVTPIGSHLRPKPLNAIIGTPTGHYGRAVISTTTPFEERQRLAEDNGGGNENDRPAKRRKQNISPPSKNGYAQNLFGASMTLSRPPSSATSRYIAARTLSRQPTSTTLHNVTAKPSTSQKLAESIDLTVEADPDLPRQEIREEKSFEKGSATSRIQKRRPSSPRSSYASNLTGVALLLSGPRELLSSRVKKAPNLRVGMKEPNKDCARVSSLHSDNGDNSPEIREIESMPVVCAESARSSSPPLPAISEMISSPSGVAVAKQKKDQARRIDSSRCLRGSSPQSQQPKRPSTISKPSSTTSHKSASKASKPQSTLRIKAREPKRMMMSMGPPSSRLNSSKKPSLPKQSASRSATAPAFQESEHSQTTIQLATILHQKDESLHARLAGHHKVPDLEEDHSSPIEDNGINYQNIDALLTRRTLAKSKGNAENVSHARHIRQENLPGLELNTIRKRANNITTETSPTTEASASCLSSSPSAVVTPVVNTLLDNTMNTSFTADIGNAQKPASSTVTGFKLQETIKDVFSQTVVSPNLITLSGPEDGIAISGNAQTRDTETTLAMLRKENELAQRRAAEEQEKLTKLKEEMEIIKKKADQERLELARLEQERLGRMEKEKEEREIAERERSERTEREKSEKERLEKMEKQRIERERSEKERLERERLETEKREKERLQKERMDREEALVHEQKLEEARKLEEKRQEMARLEQERLIREAVLKERARIEEAHRLREEEEERTRSKQAAIAAKELLKSTENKECREVQNISAMNIGAAQRTRRTVKSTSSALSAHLENGIFSATDRFRRMITAPQTHPDATKRLDSAAGEAQPSIPTKLEPFSSSLGITRSLEPSHHPTKTPNGTDTRSLNVIPEAPILAVAAMTSGVTKAFKLSRPKISETNAPPIMSPPQRNEGTLAGASDENIILTRSREKAATSGPWSPEAFDLFSWRPPP